MQKKSRIKILLFLKKNVVLTVILKHEQDTKNKFDNCIFYAHDFERFLPTGRFGT